MAMFRITSSKVVPYAVRAISSREALSGSIKNATNGCDQNTGISHHHYSTDAKKQIDDKLVKIIKSEINLKQALLKKPDTLAYSLVPNDCPFKIEDNPWEKHVIMSRDIFGGEKIDIFVDLHCCSRLLEDEIDDADISSSDDETRLGLRLKVKISKQNGNVLEIIAYAYADGEMRICKYSILKECSESSQPWPRFGSHDVKEGAEFEGALKEFLKIRGIKRSNYKFILYKHMIQKYKYSPVVTLMELSNFIAD